MAGDGKKIAGLALLGAVLGWAASKTVQPDDEETAAPEGGYPWPPPASRGVPFAGGAARPFFPIESSTNRRFGVVSYRDLNGKWHGRASRAFKASRGSRFHAGIDLFANPGDIVLAPEDGVVVGRQTFYAGTGAMLIELDSGIVVLLGETKMGGADEFGVTKGSRVRAGQPVSRIGLSNTGSHMLHFETYRAGTTKNIPWYKGRSNPPPALLDPSDYLLRGRARLEAVA